MVGCEYNDEQVQHEHYSHKAMHYQPVSACAVWLHGLSLQNCGTRARCCKSIKRRLCSWHRKRSPGFDSLQLSSNGSCEGNTQKFTQNILCKVYYSDVVIQGYLYCCLCEDSCSIINFRMIDDSQLQPIKHTLELESTFPQ